MVAVDQPRTHYDSAVTFLQTLPTTHLKPIIWVVVEWNPVGLCQSLLKSVSAPNFSRILWISLQPAATKCRCLSMRSRRVLSDVATVMHCAPTYQFCAFTMHTVIFPRTQQTIQLDVKLEKKHMSPHNTLWKINNHFMNLRWIFCVWLNINRAAGPGCSKGE